MSFRTPKYRMHKGSGQALVQIDGQRIYLGKYGTEENKEKYRRLVAEFLASRQRVRNRLTDSRPAQTSVNELILAYWLYAKQRYVKNGRSTSEIRSFRTALGPVQDMYGREPVAYFGPIALVACRQKLIDAGYCRKRSSGLHPHAGHAITSAPRFANSRAGSGKNPS